MDTEDALKKEEERLMRAISRQGSVRTGAIKAAPKVAPKPVETPKITPPASNRNSVSFSRSASRLSTQLSAEEQQKLELELQEQERKREEERKTLERLDSAHFKKKQLSKDWFDIEFKDEDVDDTPATSTSKSNLSVQSVPKTEPVTAVNTAAVNSTTTSSGNNNTSASTTKPSTTSAPITSTAVHTTATSNTVPSAVTNTNTTHARVSSTSTAPSTHAHTTNTNTTTTTPTQQQQQGWVSDMDQLINSLATLGSGVTPRHKSPQEIALDTSTTTLRSLKWNFAAPLPEPRHAELGVWIKGLGADLRQLRSILESAAPQHNTFPYVTCAGVTQSLVTAVLDSLALVTAAADRKEISTALLALVDRTLDWFEAMGRDSSEVTALRDSTGEALTALVRQVTAVIKRQTELSTPVTSSTSSGGNVPAQSRQAVVSVVEECARHAELISETLKSPPYNLEQFKQQLHHLVAAVKKIDPYLTREGDRETVVQSTKHVLEMAIELQAQPELSPLPVLTAISELLRALTAALRSQ